MKLEDLQDLFVEELRDLYSAENQLIKALPKMAKAASAPVLKSAFSEHLKQSEGQVGRLEKIFERLDKKPKGKTCKAMEGLVEEGSEMIKEDAEPAVKDAGLIAAAQRVEHYEIAGYGTVVAYAKLLKDAKVGAPCSRRSRLAIEEGRPTRKLTLGLAESLINVEAGNRPVRCRWRK